MMRVQVIMNDNLVKRVDELAKDLGMSRSSFCAMIIRLYLPRYNENKENPVKDGGAGGANP